MAEHHISGYIITSCDATFVGLPVEHGDRRQWRIESGTAHYAATRAEERVSPHHSYFRNNGAAAGRGRQNSVCADILSSQPSDNCGDREAGLM
jgi:hypothetical protein